MIRHELKDVTFIIPVRIESDDRLRNVITTLCYLNTLLDTNFIIHEHDKESIFANVALPQIEEYCEGDIGNIKHTFFQTDEPLFHRQKVLNDMLMEVDTSVVVNYDTDILLPYDAYKEAYKLIMEGADLVYPYARGMAQQRVQATDEVVSEFLNKNCDFRILANVSTPYDAQYGFCQFFNTASYIEGGMENENFRAYAPEDVERYHRFKKLGYNVQRCGNTVYHLEHSRTENSWFNNPHMDHNNKEWEKIQQFDRHQLKEYITNLPYYVARTSTSDS